MGDDGLAVIDKPAGWTSHDVVARTRRLAGTRKVGHAGTLDPMATGVLILGVNRGTKLLGHLLLSSKVYDATIRLGSTTTTDDAEGELIETVDASRVSDDAIVAAVRALTGDLLQVPSSVSAIKVDGKRSYARVRAGEDVQLEPRPVRVERFDIHDIRREGAHLELDVTVEVSSGTYVRALARDLGMALAVGGHLSALRRTSVAEFGLDRAQTLEEAEAGLRVLPLAEAVRATFPTRELSAAEATDIGYGRSLGASGTPGTVGVFFEGRCLALVADEGERAKPQVVFAPA